MHHKTGRLPKHCLVVEDDSGTSKILKKILEHPIDQLPGSSNQSKCVCGPWEIIVAPSAHVAASVLRENEFDVILLDLELSDTGGEGTINVIREAAPDVCIVVHSGIDDPKLVPRLLSENTVQDYIVKGDVTNPLALKQLLCHAIDRWNTWLDLQATERELEQQSV